jgi:hypothetical protein
LAFDCGGGSGGGNRVFYLSVGNEKEVSILKGAAKIIQKALKKCQKTSKKKQKNGHFARFLLYFFGKSVSFLLLRPRR